MTALTPDEVTKAVADIVGLLERGVRAGGGGSGIKQRRESLDVAYRWLHNEAFGLSANDAPAATACSVCGGDGFTFDDDRHPKWRKCEECTPRAHSDPTGDAAVTRARRIEVVSRVSDAMGEARRHLLVAVSLIVGETDRLGSGEGPTQTPLTIDEGELKRARAAQRARQERGEGVA